MTQLTDQDRQLIGLSAWNTKLLSVMASALYVRDTRTALIPVTKINRKVERALDFLVEFEQAKHNAILSQLARQVAILEQQLKELIAIPGWKVWLTYNRTSKLNALMTQRQCYVNAMGLVIDCLPEDISALTGAVELQKAEDQVQEQPTSKDQQS